MLLTLSGLKASNCADCRLRSCRLIFRSIRCHQPTHGEQTVQINLNRCMNEELLISMVDITNNNNNNPPAMPTPAWRGHSRRM